MSLYHDPLLAYPRPSLISDLLTVPATKEQHQAENQATTVLAWLVDRSPTIAHAVLRLFLGDHAPAHGTVAARTQLTLPKPDGGGALYPDLSICVEDRALQLLVEIKVGTNFHRYDEFGGRTQPEVYRLVWGEPRPAEARMRAVGTLTRDGSQARPDPDRLIARDVSWRELRDALAQQLRYRSIEPAIRLIAESLVDAVDGRIAPVPLSDAELHAFWRSHESLLDAVTKDVVSRLPTAGEAKAISGMAYFGQRVPLASANGEPLFLRIYISPAGTGPNLPGGPDAFIAAPERDANGTLEESVSPAVEAAGFLKTKDLDGYWLHRHVWALQRLDRAAVVGELVDSLKRTALLAA
jgi:hypothetical protein